MPVQVYGLVRSEHSEPPTGVRLVRSGPIAAAVSDIADTELHETEALGYLDVLSALLRDGPVLPARFGTVAPDEAAVREEILDPDADFVAGRGTVEAQSGVWRFRKLLPPIPAEHIVTRFEGNNPLYRDQRLADYAGLTGGQFAIKHEGHNPTASFKDRGMTVGVTQAKRIGAAAVACASTGNTSASLAAYAAQAGLPALVLVPAEVEDGAADGLHLRSSSSTTTAHPKQRNESQPMPLNSH